MREFPERRVGDFGSWRINLGRVGGAVFPEPTDRYSPALDGALVIGEGRDLARCRWW
jgi:hypothetical protein